MASLATSRTAVTTTAPRECGSSKPTSRCLMSTRGFSKLAMECRRSYRPTTALRVSAPRSSNSSSTLNPFGDDCAERTDTAAMKAIASQYFAQVGDSDPCLKSIMTDECVMTDRVLGWCFRGRDAVEGHFKDFHAKYCSHEFSYLDVLTNLDSRTVCAHWALTVCTRDENAPCVPDYEPSRQFQINGVHLFTLNSDNKIANITTYRTSCNADEDFNY